jgi:hypothetical protein
VEAIQAARPKIESSLNDRAADIWEPLMVLADLAAGQWPRLARQAAVHLSTAAQETDPMISLMLDLLVICAEWKDERIFSRYLVWGLNTQTERPWAEAKNGKEITELWLSQKLRPYGLRPKNICVSGQQAKGYVKEEMMEMFRRYIPQSVVREMLAEKRQGRPEAGTVEGREQLPQTPRQGTADTGTA